MCITHGSCKLQKFPRGKPQPYAHRHRGLQHPQRRFLQPWGMYVLYTIQTSLYTIQSYCIHMQVYTLHTHHIYQIPIPIPQPDSPRLPITQSRTLQNLNQNSASSHATRHPLSYPSIRSAVPGRKPTSSALDTSPYFKPPLQSTAVHGMYSIPYRYIYTVHITVHITVPSQSPRVRQLIPFHPSSLPHPFRQSIHPADPCRSHLPSLVRSFNYRAT